MQQLPVLDLVELTLVGCGGFGKVYRGKSQKMGMEVAWKVLRGTKHEELLKEAVLMHKANYTYVLRVLSTYVDQKGEFGLVMEYMPHGALASLMQMVEGIPWALKFQILHQVALGMNYLHHVLKPPILHRDLKPENILLDRFLDVKLTDFGLAKIESTVSTTEDGTPGTLSYMPPEALTLQDYKATKEFDVYSFGILTWSVVSWKRPYDGVDTCLIPMFISRGQRPDMSLVKLWRNEKMVPKGIEMMEKCWERDPRRRPSFSTCKDWTEEMNEAYAGEIDDARDKVLKELRTIYSSLSSQETWALDTPDGGDMSGMSRELNTDIINRFGWLLDPTEPLGPVDVVTAEEEEPEIQDPKDFLRKNFAKIVQGAPDLSGIWDELYAEDFITEELLDTMRSGHPVQEQIRRTLRVVIAQGQETCRKFLTLMWRHKRTLIRELQTDSA